MENRYNACIVSFNTGNSLVTDVHLLYKEANDSTIKVIERIINHNQVIKQHFLHIYILLKVKYFLFYLKVKY